MAMLFFKKNCSIPEFFISKKVGQEFSYLKVLVTKDHFSLNYGPLNMLFRFTDS